MKTRERIILLVVMALMVLGGGELKAQPRQYFGVKGGWGEADVRLYPHWTTPPVWGKFNGGLYWVYYGGGKTSSYLGDEYTGGICVELEFMQRGFQYAALDRNTKRYTYGRKMNSIVVPLMWQPHVYLLQDRLRLFLNAGATLSYNLCLGSKYYYIDNETGAYEEYDYEWQAVRDNRWGYGLVVGLGGGWNFDKIEVMFETRYYFGYSDITKRKTIYLGTQFLRSPLDNINFNIGVAYHWEHSGSWSYSPATRKAKRAAQMEILPTDEAVIENGELKIEN